MTNIDIKSFHEKIALHMTAKNRHGAIVQLLLKNNINVDSRNKYDLMSLISVVENSYEIIMELLFENNVNIIVLD